MAHQNIKVGPDYPQNQHTYHQIEYSPLAYQLTFLDWNDARNPASNASCRVINRPNKLAGSLMAVD